MPVAPEHSTQLPAELLLARQVLGDLADEVVFVGGLVVPVWVVEPAAPEPRATDDVDVVCNVGTYPAYAAFGERLRVAGLAEAADSTVICRWRHQATGLTFDVMPRDGDALGFSNRWYELVLETAVSLPTKVGQLRVARPDVLVATKLEAWRGRGGDDVVRSIDLSDVVTLIDGRPSLPAEFHDAPNPLREFVGTELRSVAADPYFDYLVSDIASRRGDARAGRAHVIRQRISDLLTELA